MKKIKRLMSVESLESRFLMAAHTWTGATSPNWSDPGSWVGGVPSASESNVTLDFPSGGAPNLNNDIAGLIIQSMTFEGAYNLNGDAFTLDQSITSGPMALNVSNNMSVSSLASISIGYQAWFGGSISGLGGINATGSGILLLAASNSYSGPTTVTSGTVIAGNSGSLGSLPDLTVNAGATLQLDPGVNPGVASLNGSGTIDGAGGLTDFTMGTDFFSGQLRGSASLTLNAGGDLHLNGTTASDGTGTITVENGRLSVNTNLSSANLVLNGGETFGNGTVGTFNQSGGIVQPGIPGAIHVAGNLNLGSASEWDWTGASDTNYQAFTAGGSVTLGQRFFLDFLVPGFTPATGTVFTLINNQGSQPVTGTFHGLPNGSIISNNGANFRMSYTGGDGNDVALTYLGVPTTIAISSDSASATFGKTVLHGTVGHSGSTLPTGTVTFFDGSTQIGTASVGANGVATLQASSLGVGVHSAITAVYGGDSVYENSGPSSPVSQTVTQASTTLSVADPSPVSAGTPATLTATVSESASATEPTGPVTFYINGAPIGVANLDGSGHASLSGAIFPVGADQITASYAGDTSYVGSSASAVNVNILPAISSSNVTVTKSSTGTSLANFVVSLSAASNQSVSVSYATAAGNAVAGTDFVASSGTLTFSPGQTTQTVSITVIGQANWQLPRQFSLTLSSPVNATIVSGATATINSVDAIPSAGVMPDELNPSQSNLIVHVPAGNAAIQIKPTKVAGQLEVADGRKILATGSNLAHLVIYGAAGNQKLTIDRRINTSVIFFGGSGRDTVTGGNGNDILVGGSSGSVLSGGNGRNLLIGGPASAKLKGSALGDILVGGATAYDTGRLSDIFSLESILNGWTNGASYSARTTAITAGVGANDANLGPSSVQELASDHLTGKAGRDWLLMKTPAPKTHKHG